MPSDQTTLGNPPPSGYEAFIERVNPRTFYTRLIQSAEAAHRSLSLIYLPPEHLPYPEFEMYLKRVNELIESSTLWIRRMVAINDLRKMELVIADLRQFSDRKSFSVALIDPGCTVRYWERNYPLPANVQIIDDEVAYLVDPVHGYHQEHEDQATSLIICSKDYAEVMKSYYEEWWKKCATLKDSDGVHKAPLYDLLERLRAEANGDEDDGLGGLLAEL